MKAVKSVFFVATMFVARSAFSQCPTEDDFRTAVADWQDNTTLFELVEIANDLPGWSLILEGVWMTMVSAPDEIDVGDIVEGGFLGLTIRHWGNDCVVTQVNALPDAGSISVLERRQVDEYTEDIDYRITPSITGDTRPSFLLLDEGGSLIEQSILKLYVKSLFDLTVFVGAGTAGTPTTGGVFVEGDEIEYAYSLEPCHNELEVSINGAFVDGSGSFLMSEDTFLEALSTGINHLVTVASTIGGMTDRDGVFGVACEGSLTITATPDQGYRFVGWSGDASGMDNPLTVYPSTALNITANFEEVTYMVTVTSANGGSTDRTGENIVPHGGTLTVTSTPFDRWSFVEWTGDASGNTNPLTLTNITSDLSVQAEFEAEPGAVIWTRLLGGRIIGSPAIQNNRIYVGNVVGSGFGFFHAIDASTGSFIWRVEKGSVESSAAVANGNVYFVHRTDFSSLVPDTIACLDENTGADIWETPISVGMSSRISPTVEGQDILIGGGARIFSLNANTGAEQWQFPVDIVGELDGAPAVNAGRLYMGEFHMYCLDITTGGQIWKTTPGTVHVIHNSPAYSDGKVYFGSRDHNAYCLDAMTGATVWTFTGANDDYFRSSPAVSNGRVYIGNINRRLYCLNATTGAKEWEFVATDAFADSSPAVSDGYVYIGDQDGKLYCVRASDGYLMWDFQTGGSVLHSSPAVANGFVYMSGWDGRLYCLKAQTDGQSDWPQFRRDAQNTGKNDGI